MALLLLVPSALESGRGAAQMVRIAASEGGPLEAWTPGAAWLSSGVDWVAAGVWGSPAAAVRPCGRMEIGLGPAAERRAESQNLAPPRGV